MRFAASRVGGSVAFLILRGHDEGAAMTLSNGLQRRIATHMAWKVCWFNGTSVDFLRVRFSAM